jgi:hypothetical protein
MQLFSVTAAEVSVEPPRWLQNYSPKAGDEELIFTPEGFDRPGKPAIATGGDVVRLRVSVRDKADGRPTFCRVNVVGGDGNFYQPQKTHLTPYSLTGVWPKTLAGNRPGKAPIRYFGRFFYSTGEFEIFVPPGPVRIEVWKGFEYRPQHLEIEVGAKERRTVELSLERTVDMAELGYYSGDSHLHFDRKTAEDDRTILDLLEAEDVRYGMVLCYNGTGAYDGRMAKQDIQQIYAGLGTSSIRSRGDYQIMSAQEYRSGQFGHTKVFLSDAMVQAGKAYDPNGWPVFGEAVQDIRSAGGLVFWAHGGYSKEIFADYVLGTVDGVELMQFGIYRPIGLEGWYKILNIGYRFPALGASDFPACRKLADCRTYVWSDGVPGMEGWLRGAAVGRAFMTTGPMVLMTVNGRRPGATIELPAQGGSVSVKVRVRSEVAPVTNVDLIVNGSVERRWQVPSGGRLGEWIELAARLEIPESAWLAASAYSSAQTGNPDAEAHTNPVYLYAGGRAPYRAADLEWLLAKLDERIVVHQRRRIAVGKGQVLAYFRKARTRLLEIRDAGGMPAPDR